MSAEVTNEGLLADLDDWTQLLATGKRGPSHNCNQKCLKRVDHTGDADQDYRCCKPHYVLGKIDPNHQE